LCILKITTPKSTATTIRIVFIKPVVEKDILIKTVEIINPEFRMTL